MDPGEPVEVFYGGAAGGGKSDWMLQAALQYADVPGYAAIIFRRTYADLSLPGALMERAGEWLSGTPARWVDRDKTWAFPSGASLTFGYLEHDVDRYRYKSAEFQMIGFDELTQFTERQYTYLFSRLRRLEGVPVPLRMLSASNPGDRGHAWVRDRFIEPREKVRNRVFIPAKIRDNPHLDKPAYLASLSHLGPVLQLQLAEGIWDAYEGLAYRLIKGVHVVPAFPVDNWWGRFEAMDYGTAAPTSWGCFATDYDGNVIAHGLHHKPGYPSDTAAAIHLARERWWGRRDDGRLVPAMCYGPADLKRRWGSLDVHGREVTAELEFNERGLFFAPAQMDRRAGYVRVAEMLKPDPERPFPDWHPLRGELGAPRFFILDTDELEPLRSAIRDAPLEDEDSAMSRFPLEAVDAEWESKQGHAHAMLRYALMSRPSPSPEPRPVNEDPRAAQVQARLDQMARREADDLVNA